VKAKKVFNPTKAHLYRNKPSISKAYQTTEKTSISLINGDNDSKYCKSI